MNRNIIYQGKNDKGEYICPYCESPITTKKYRADGQYYHLECVRKLKKILSKMKKEGRIEEGKENRVKIIKEGGYY